MHLKCIFYGMKILNLIDSNFNDRSLWLEISNGSYRPSMIWSGMGRHCRQTQLMLGLSLRRVGTTEARPARQHSMTNYVNRSYICVF